MLSAPVRCVSLLYPPVRVASAVYVLLRVPCRWLEVTSACAVMMLFVRRVRVRTVVAVVTRTWCDGTGWCVEVGMGLCTLLLGLVVRALAF